ncbi:cytochrome P450 CYP736A12-like [Abrus precatorius]|uniref:Cytochrome P450 CYP736A12-like n=1 Tax=Abrus precatorius TaxID=3816 RepID=A0A8B8LN61_ABRPR|nr:cytochrome P450 CYP736A12-like [Abrus precatorius]
MFPSTFAISWIVLTVIFILSATLLRRRREHHRKQPPGPPALWVLGHLHMLGHLPHRTLRTWSQKYGPIMSLRLGQVPTIVVSSPEAAEQFLKTHETVFANRPKIEASKYFSYGYKGMVFAEYGTYWRQMRKVCTLQLLSASKVESFGALRKMEVEAVVKSLQKGAMVGEVVNLSEVVTGLLEDVVYKMVLGCSKDDKFDLKGLLQEATLLAGKFNLSDFVPWLRVFDIQGLRRGFKKTGKALDEVLEKIIEEHEQASIEQNGSHKDFVDILLSMMHQPIDPYDEHSHAIDRTNIKAIVLDMIAASFETSSTVILWALSELLRHPRVMKKLQHELATVVGMNKLVEESDIVKLSYLDMVIKETLRLHPAGSFITRFSREDTMINGYHIKKNSEILVNIWAIGRDPKVWSDNADLIPFGSGRRGCPGINLGLATVKLVVFQLVHCFNWKLPWGMTPDDLDMKEQFGLTSPRTTPLLAVPTYQLQIAPGPKALPIIGNLHMLGKLPHRSLQSLAKKYGPIMSLKLGQVSAIVVSSPETAELFLKTHDTLFASRPKLQASESLSHGSKGLAFSEYGAYWRNMRKLCTLQLLSASKVEMFAPLRREELGGLVKALKNASASCEVVDLSELLGELIENIVFKMILGRTKDDRFELKGLVHEVMNLVGAFNIADYMPWLGLFDPQGLTRRLKKASKAFDQVLEHIIEDHEHPSNNEQKGSGKDFVDILLSHLHQPIDLQDEQKHVIDRTNIKAIILDIITAALDTSTVTVDWAMSELLRHPSVMKRLQDELENVVGLNKQVEENDLEKLPYLNMVVKETLRLYPVAPLLLPRESREDVTIESYYINKKSRIIINAWAIGRDPKVWSHTAEMFDPERFANSNVDIRGNDFRVLPFGSGRRSCPGIHLGLTTVKLVLAQLVHCFNWVLPLGISPDELDMDENFGLTMPRNKHLLTMPIYRLVD